ncbi:MAG: hypothetical protein V4649_08270 [Bacteroidota bacterium]
MITIKDFLTADGNTYTRKLLLDTIDEIKMSNVDNREIEFNVFTVTIYPQRKQVVIERDLSPDKYPAITVSLEDFYEAVKAS